LATPQAVSAQKKFDLDDFIKPSAPATNSGQPGGASEGKPPSTPIDVESAPKPAREEKEKPAAEVPETPAGARRDKREAAAETRAAAAEQRAAAAQQRAADRASAAEERAAARATATQERAAAAEARRAAAEERAAAKLKPKHPKKKTAYDLMSEEWHAPA